MNYACEIRLLLSGEMVIIGYDVINERSVADWLSFRMVKLSGKAIDLCFADTLKRLFYSKSVVDPSTINPSELCKSIAIFCGFPSMKKLDESSKSVLALGDKEENVEFVPYNYERGGGFTGEKCEHIYSFLGSQDLLAKLKSAFFAAKGSSKWDDVA